MGTSKPFFSRDIQFGHAGASATSEFESSGFKNKYMKDVGIHVPENFEEFSTLLSKVSKEHNCHFNAESKEVRKPPQYFNSSRRMTKFFSSISDESKSELEYNKVKISEILSKDSSLGMTIGHLWLKKELPQFLAKYIEMILVIVADHGSMVSGTHNSIVASRAGKDLVSSLCSGLLTIGNSFGGAINLAAKQFY